jgi:iron complex outermembrane receptor protein
MFSAAAVAQETAAAPVEKIEVTGSLIKRIEGETALPVSVVTKEEIQKSGASTVEQLLQALPVATTAGATTSSQNAGALTAGLTAVSLHGLGSVRVLVLVNGRRVAPYGVVSTDSTSVDVNSLPLSAIERIEVLKEGASAIYGSDAIGGVVNFILRRDYQGAEISAHYGQAKQGGGATKGVSLIYGVGDLQKDRYNFMITASDNREEPLWGRDRSFSASGLSANDFLLGYDNTSSNTFPGNVTPTSGPAAGKRINPAYPNCGPVSSNDPNFAPISVTNPAFTGAFGQCRFDPSPYVQSIDKAEHQNIFTSFKYNITDTTTAYAEASINRNIITDVIQPSPVSDLFSIPPGNVLDNLYPYNDALFGGSATPGPTASSRILLQPGTPYYPYSLISQVVYARSPAGSTPLPLPGQAGFSPALYPTLNVRYRTFFNGGRSHTDTSESPRFTLGVKGTVFDWDFDANVLHSQNQVTEHDNNGFWIQSKMLPFLNSGNFNLMYPAIGPAPTDGQIAQARSYNFDGDAFISRTYLDSVTAKLSGDLFPLPGGSSALAVGAELRREKYELLPNAYLATGDISGYGGNTIGIDKQRNVYAGFAEFDAPIIKGVEATVSGRFDHYENTGSKVSPKFSLRLQPIPEILVRGSISKGFRAPSLTDLYSPVIQDVTATITDPKDCVGATGFGCNQQFTQSLGGNTKLKPERSTNLSLGIVLQPTRNISASVDYFDIKIKDVIAQGGIDPSFIIAHQDVWAFLITRAIPDPALPPGTPGCPPTTGCLEITNVNGLNLNVGSQRNQGFDAEVNWGLPLGEWGKLTANLNATYFQRVVLQNPDGSYTDQIDTADQTLSINGGMIPRWKHRLGLDWARGDWDVLMVQNYQGTYLDSQQIGGTGNNHVDAYYTYDANVGYTGIKNWRLAVGVRNLTDQDPPFTGLGGSKWFQSGFDPSYADPRGRFIYGAITYRIK